MTRLLLIVAIFVMSVASSAQAGDCLRLTRTLQGSFGDIWQPFYDSMAASGFCLNILDVPDNRALIMFNNGESDGEFLQTADRMDSLGPNAVMVPEPIHHGIGLFVTRIGSGIQPDPANHIHVGHLTGESWSKAAASQYMHSKEISGFGSGLRMVRAGRLDAFLIDDFRWKQRKHLHQGLQATEIGRGTAHMVLHKRFTPKLDQISKAIRLAKGGHDSYLNYYLEQHPSQ